MLGFPDEATAMPQDTITLALAILSIVILIRLLLSDVFAVLGLDTLKNGFSGGPEDANSYWPTKLDDDLYQDMLALGFQPVGTYWEHVPFMRRFEEFVFTRPKENCFGILYPNDQIMPRRASFFTVFHSGGVVFTKNYSGGVEIQERDFLATGPLNDPVSHLPSQLPVPAWSSWKPIVFCLAVGLFVATLLSESDRWMSSNQRIVLWALSGLGLFSTLLQIRPRDAAPRGPEPQRGDLDLRMPLAETLARHRLNVNLLIADGQQLPTVFDGEEFTASQERYYRHPRLRRLHQASMGTLLLAKLLILAPLPAFFFYRLGAHHPLPWSILLIEGLAGLYLRYGCSTARVVDILRGLVRDW
jgi:hypothetical protein